MNYACSVEYIGTHFHGWQTQKEARSVQQNLEQALSKVANETVAVQCSGRTDAGVHALNQVVNFKSSASRTLVQWHKGINTNLPKDISVNWVAHVDEDFNARFCATRRHYRYVLFVNDCRSALFNERAYWIRTQLNIDLMNLGAKYLVGEHDFNAYRSAQCQAKHANRFIESINVTQKNQFVYIDVIGNAFLQNMVRIIVGTLIEVGLEKQKPDWVDFLLKNKDRSLGAKTAPACGLYFLEPKYPQKYNLPNFSRYPGL